MRGEVDAGQSEGAEGVVGRTSKNAGRTSKSAGRTSKKRGSQKHSVGHEGSAKSWKGFG
ncbi:hypothetical protein KI387_026705, partial [Taxus chinensis]